MRFKKLFPLVCADYVNIDTDEGKVVFSGRTDDISLKLARSIKEQRVVSIDSYMDEDNNVAVAAITIEDPNPTVAIYKRRSQE